MRRFGPSQLLGAPGVASRKRHQPRQPAIRFNEPARALSLYRRQARYQGYQSRGQSHGWPRICADQGNWNPRQLRKARKRARRGSKRQSAIDSTNMSKSKVFQATTAQGGSHGGWRPKPNSTRLHS